MWALLFVLCLFFLWIFIRRSCLFFSLSRSSMCKKKLKLNETSLEGIRSKTVNFKILINFHIKCAQTRAWRNKIKFTICTHCIKISAVRQKNLRLVSSYTEYIQARQAEREKRKKTHKRRSYYTSICFLPLGHCAVFWSRFNFFWFLLLYALCCCSCYCTSSEMSIYNMVWSYRQIVSCMLKCHP